MNKKAIIKDVQTLSCSNSWRNYYFLKIETECGIVGWSEFDQNFGSPGVEAAINQLVHRLIGQDAMLHEFIHADLRNVTRPGSGGVVGQALGAIENALLDIKAKKLDVPCYQLLGGKIRDRVRVYWSHCVSYRARVDHFTPPIHDIKGVEQIARDARDWGYTGLKTNIFQYDEQDRISNWAPGFGRQFDPGRSVEKSVRKNLKRHLEVMREHAGPDMDILVDLNFNARTEGYLEIVRELNDLDLFWIELDMLDPKGLAMIRQHSKNPIASLETLIGLQQFLPYLENRSVDVAIVDTPWNGVWQSMKIAAACDAYETNVACHNFYGHLCTMMNAHFCAAVPNLRIMEIDIDRIPWDEKIFTHVPEIVDGYLTIPDRPGWGTDPIEEALRDYPPVQQGFLHTALPKLN